jgi:S2P endopeptidase
LFLIFIYPGAYVNIREELRELPPLKQLKIYCAGAWHNAVLGMVRL